MKYRIYLLLLPLLILQSGCTGDTKTQEPSQTPNSADILPVRFTPEETAFLSEVRHNGGFRVATVLNPGAYERDDEGGEHGFTRRMLQALGEVLDIPVRVEFVEFEEIFMHNGEVPSDVTTNMDRVYTPDLLTRVDIIAFDLTDVTWRSGLMTIVPLVPTRGLIINRRGEDIRYAGQMRNKKAAVYEHTSHEIFLRSLESTLGIHVDIIPVPFKGDRLDLVTSGRVDFTVADSQVAVIELADIHDLNISYSLTDIKMNGWAVARDNLVLASVLKKFFEYTELSGILNEAWREGYGMSLREYYSLIGFNDTGSPSFSPEEKDYIDRLQRRGGLLAAITRGASIYEQSENGEAEGLHYHLALEAAHILGIPIKLIPVDFPELFNRDGEVPEELKTDTEFSYVPDLLSEVDMYISTLTPLPWRRKFLDFVNIYPSKVMIVVRKGLPNIGLDELHDYHISLLVETSYESILRDLYDLSELSITRIEQYGQDIQLVSDGLADVTLTDANLLLADIAAFPDITVYPAVNSIDMLSWAVAADNVLLKEILEKTISYIRTTGRFNAIWEDYYGITFNEYLNLIEE